LKREGTGDKMKKGYRVQGLGFRGWGIEMKKRQQKEKR
jgi:hypothetical protein